MSKKDKITIAAKMAADWWAERLNNLDRREAFSIALAGGIERLMRGEIQWVRQFEQRQGYKVLTTVQAPGDGKNLDRLWIEFDYDPDATLETALQEVFGPGLGVLELQDFFPRKHTLMVTTKKLVPKEGYANPTADIPVP